MSPHGAFIAEYALTQVGKPYVFGAEVNLADDDPDAFDCSELVQWAIWRAGRVVAPDGAWVQQHWCYREGGSPAMGMAAMVPGVLLFRLRDGQGAPLPPSYVGGRPSVSHVGISTGDGHVVEALNPRVGVRVAPFSSTRWTAAFTVPQFDYHHRSTPVDDQQPEDEDMPPIYLQFDGAIWRRDGNVGVLLTQETYNLESGIAEFVGKPLTVVTDEDAARTLLDGCIDSNTGQSIRF